MSDTKQAAAVAAVADYIKTQEEAMAWLQSRTAEVGLSAEKTTLAAPQAAPHWGVFGRQEQMQMRSMMQMKAFHASKRNI